MRRILLFFLVIAPMSLSAQNTGEIKDGFQQFRYPNGNISSEGLIRNGKPDGYWKSYYITGVLKSEGKRRSYLLDSIWVFFDQSGDTTEKISYLLGKRNGYYIKYQKDPVYGSYVYSKELYAGDKKEGVALIYYPEGKVRQTIPYYNGLRDGLSREYDREGKIISLLEYNNDFLISREKINFTDAAGQKQGEWLEFYPGGNIRVEKNYRNDLLHGYYKEYDERGKLVVTLLYEEGKVTGTDIDTGADIEIVNKYDDNGRLTFSGPFKAGVPVGIHREYTESGSIKGARIYNDNGLLISEGIVDEAGNRNGAWKDFSPEGVVTAEGAYADNRRTGQWKFYSPSGKLEQAGSYSNGRIEGTWRWYYPEGELLREEDYAQGRRDGNYTEYTREGEIIAQGTYADGERNGEWHFRTGDNTESGSYLLGFRDGPWKAYYANGKLRFRGSYSQGSPIGHHILYYENGRIKEERYYENGLRSKTWKKYNEEGEVVLTITYRDDIETNINGVSIKLPESDVKLIK
jgi:antitoxin component YwqK of YwqJK toxin-antitoxin module